MDEQGNPIVGSDAVVDTTDTTTAPVADEVTEAPAEEVAA